VPACQSPPPSASDITAIASACVAVCALFMTLWQAKIARRHNRLSVRPHLDFEREAYPTKRIRLIVRNEGLGPAFITEVEVRFAGGSFKLEQWAKLPDSIRQEIDALALRVDYLLFGPGTVLRAGATQMLMEFPGTEIEGAKWNAALELLARIEFHITYESLYQQADKMSIRLPAG
jgi:hypothetical protein